jgi:hypothetical protein
MIPKKLIVHRIIEVKDKNNKLYKSVLLITEEGLSITRKELSKTNKVFSASIQIWEEPYLEINILPFYIKEKEIILGDIVKKEVLPYNILNPVTNTTYTVNTFTTVVLGDSTKSNWNHKIYETFRKKGKIIKEY